MSPKPLPLIKMPLINTPLNHSKAFTLVELVIAIVIAGIVMTGVVVTSANLSLRSADPMLAAQRLHLARSYMEEILAQEFIISSTNCTYADRPDMTKMCQYRALDNVQVENQFGDVPSGLEGYTVSVTLANTNNLGPSNTISSSDAALITVTITSLNGQSTILSGYATNI